MTETVDRRARRVDLKYHVGDDVVVQWNFTENGVLMPWAGVTVETEITDVDGVAAAEQFTFSTPSNGALIVRLSEIQTAAMGEGKWIYRITVTRNGETLTYFNGELTLTLRHKVSRP